MKFSSYYQYSYVYLTECMIKIKREKQKVFKEKNKNFRNIYHLEIYIKFQKYIYHSDPSNSIARNYFVSISIQNPKESVLDTNKCCDVRAIETTSKMFEVHPYLETPRSKIYYGPQTFRPDMGIRLTGRKKKNPFKSMSARNTFEIFELLLSRVAFFFVKDKTLTMIVFQIENSLIQDLIN